MFVLLIERGSHLFFFAVSDGLPAAIYEHDYLKALLFRPDVLHTPSLYVVNKLVERTRTYVRREIITKYNISSYAW